MSFVAGSSPAGLRHRGDARFATLIGGQDHYAWTEEGPDMQAMFRGRRAGRTWHA